MTSEPDAVPLPAPLPPGGSALDALRSRTPARIAAGRSGAAYRTATQLELWRDHAFAVDAVQAELDLAADFAPELVETWQLFPVSSRATSKRQYLIQPELGRQLDAAGRQAVVKRCQRSSALLVAIGDGLSAAAVRAQVPRLLAALGPPATARGWTIGPVPVIRYCRVGVLNDLGELVQPDVAVLLIGERPGLATAESLSAYMAYRPRGGHTDAQRNLVSNIHSAGVSPVAAAARIVALAEQMRRLGGSGIAVKEQWQPALEAPPAGDAGEQ